MIFQIFLYGFELQAISILLRVTFRSIVPHLEAKKSSTRKQLQNYSLRRKKSKQTFEKLKEKSF